MVSTKIIYKIAIFKKIIKLINETKLILHFIENSFKIINMNQIQKNNPLHGITLESIINDLVFYFDWDTLGELIQINCFRENPSVKSSLTFLRKTPWAREKVERLYLKYKKRIESKKNEINI